MIEDHLEGVVVTVWVSARSSRDEVIGPHDDALKVSTTAPPEGGRANRRVVGLVVAAVGGRGGRLLSGERSRRKRVLVFGTSRDAAQRALASRSEER